MFTYPYPGPIWYQYPTWGYTYWNVPQRDLAAEVDALTKRVSALEVPKDAVVEPPEPQVIAKKVEFRVWSLNERIWNDLCKTLYNNHGMFDPSLAVMSESLKRDLERECHVPGPLFSYQNPITRTKIKIVTSNHSENTISFMGER